MEWNEKLARFCISCKMILRYDTYVDSLQHQERNADIEILKKDFEQEIQALREEVANDIKKQFLELLSRLKPEIVKEGMSI
jgi:hypothetical protein